MTVEANPGTARSEPLCDPGSVCITCGDVAIELTVKAIDAERELALCTDDEDRRETVEIALVNPVAVGDRLLVHAGTAICKLDPAGADAGAREKSPRHRRGQGIPAGAEQPAGVVR